MHTIAIKDTDLKQDQNQEILDKYQPYLTDYAKRFGFEEDFGFINHAKENIIKIVTKLDGEKDFSIPIVLGSALLDSHQQIRDQLYNWGIKSRKLRNHSLFHDAHDIVGWLSQHFPNQGWQERQKQVQIIEELSFIIWFEPEEL